MSERFDAEEKRIFPEMRVGNCVLTGRHDWGMKWSIFLGEWIKTASHESLQVVSVIDRSESSVGVMVRVSRKT